MCWTRWGWARWRARRSACRCHGTPRRPTCRRSARAYAAMAARPEPRRRRRSMDLPRQPGHHAVRSRASSRRCCPSSPSASATRTAPSTPWATRRRRRWRPRAAEVAALIGAEPREIVFTSGATEANNIAIKGAARFAASQGSERRRVVTVATEHKCVLESVADLRAEGFEPVVLPVGADGLLDPALLRRAWPCRPAGQRHGRQQRDGGAAGPAPSRVAGARGRGVVPHGRCTGARQGAVRRRRHRPRLLQRAQDVWPEGRRRALCPPPAPRAPGAAVLRRRPGAGAALRHAADAADRGLRRGLPDRGAEDGRGGAGSRACATGCWPACRRTARLAGQRRPWRTGCPATSTSPCRYRRRSADARGPRAVRLHRLGLLVGRGRALLRADRDGAERRRRGPELAPGPGTLYLRRRSGFRRSCAVHRFPNSFEARSPCPR